MSRYILLVSCLAVFPSLAHAEDLSRQRIAGLIAALEKDKRKSIDLAELTGRDLGVRPDLWQKWLDGTSDKQLESIAERARRASELETQWLNFNFKYTLLHNRRRVRFDAITGRFEEDPKFIEGMAQLREENPELEAWERYRAGLKLIESGTWNEAAKALRNLLLQKPLSYYAASSDELAVLSDELALDERIWAALNKRGPLTIPERVESYLFQTEEAPSEPAEVVIIDTKDPLPLRKLQTERLRTLGKEAIPTLLTLLDDRRPIRVVAFTDYKRSPRLVMLRYQDVAIQALNELLPKPVYDGSNYLSSMPPKERFEVIDSIRKGYAASQANPPKAKAAPTGK